MAILWDLSAFKIPNSTKFIGAYTNDEWKTIIINQSISREMCNIFEIEIKQIKANAELSNNCFFVGFIRDSIDKLDKNSHLAQIRLTNKRTAIKVLGLSIYQYGCECIDSLSRCFTKGDTIRMVFDFKKNKCK